MKWTKITPFFVQIVTTKVSDMYAATRSSSLAGCRQTSGVKCHKTRPPQTSTTKSHPFTFHVSRLGVQKHSLQGESYGQTCYLGSYFKFRPVAPLSICRTADHSICVRFLQQKSRTPGNVYFIQKEEPHVAEPAWRFG
jgi:hypothetical protein